jgi:peptide/nickel transport system substrate-binding protein
MWGKRLGRGSKAGAFVMSCALLSAACTGGGNASPTPQTSASPIQRGGTLRVGLLRWNGDAPYDPTTTFDYSQYALYPCCLVRTLYYYNGKPAAQGGGIVRPDLATGTPEVSPDGLTWTIHLRPGLHYAPPLHAVEITTADFIRAIERILSPAPPEVRAITGQDLLGGFADYFQEIAGAQDYIDRRADSISGLEAPDRHTLRIHLTRPNGDLPYRLTLMVTAPIPPNPFNPEAKFGVAEGHALDGYGRFLVSSGPYMIEGSGSVDFSQPPDRQQPASGLDPLVLVRNPSWRPTSDPLRPAYPDRIEVTAYNTEPYGLEETLGFTPPVKYRLAFAKKVDAGEIDVMGDLPAPLQQVRRYRSDPSLARRLETYQYHDVRFLNLNMALPPFDDIHVRRAVNHVIDKERILEAWHRQGLDSAIIYDHLAPDATENNILASYRPYGSSDHRGNLAAARQEMRLSTYDRDHDGVCDRTACNLGRVLWRDYPGYPEIAPLVRTDLAKIGMRITPNIVDSGQMYEACTDPARHATLCQLGWEADYPSASTFFPPLYSSARLTNDCCNFSMLGATPGQLRAWKYQVGSVPNVDQRMAACQQMTGISQVQCWTAFDQYLMEEVVPAVPLLIDAAPWIFSSRVASFSWDQAAGVPALDKIALNP